VHTERACHDWSDAPWSYCAAESDGLIVHLAHYRPSCDVGPVEVVHHGGSVDLVALGEPVDRVAVSVLLDHFFNLCISKSALHRV
jgi:hypothetical protein